MLYTKQQLSTAIKYYKHFNGEITRETPGYKDYKAVCELIRKEHKFSTYSWKEVNSFLQNDGKLSSSTEISMADALK